MNILILFLNYRVKSNIFFYPFYLNFVSFVFSSYVFFSVSSSIGQSLQSRYLFFFLVQKPFCTHYSFSYQPILVSLSGLAYLLLKPPTFFFFFSFFVFLCSCPIFIF
ncbi:hypothetical protein AAZX31_08G192700 [Glycine max]